MNGFRSVLGSVTLVMALWTPGCGGDDVHDAPDARVGMDASTGMDATTAMDASIGVDATTGMDAGSDGSTPADTGTDDAAADGGGDGGSDGGDTGGCGPSRIGITFTIDDTANRTYTGADGLAWKGSFSHDVATNTLTLNPAWGGPFVGLHDDGPRSAGGHEPEGATAGDSVFGVVVCYTPDETRSFEYGAIRGSVDGSDGQWIWVGANGMFTVDAGEIEDVVLPPFVIAAFGDVDLRLTLDVDALHSTFAGFDPSSGVTVKGTFTDWLEVALVDDGTGDDETAGDDVFTFVLSDAVGAGTPLAHSGLLSSGTDGDFLFVLGGFEYKAGGAAASDGATAAFRTPTDTDWVSQPILVRPTGVQNLYVTAP